MVREDDKYAVRGPKPALSFENVTLGRLYYEVLSRCDVPYDAMVQAETNETLSYRQLFENSLMLADYLRAQGYGRNDVFSISSENNLEFFIPILSSFYIGAIMAPLNHNYTPTELSHALSISKPKLIFCSHKVLPVYKKLQKECPFIERIIVIDDLKETTKDISLRLILRHRKMSNGWRNFQPLDCNPKELNAFIMCSSGTTGLPKGVLLSHTNILVRLSQHKDPRYYEQDLGLSVIGLMPFFHAYGLLTNLGSFLLHIKVIVLRKFDEELFLKSIEQHKIRYLWLAPPLVVFLAKSPLVKKYDLSCVKQITSGAAPLGKNVAEEVKKRLGVKEIIQAYGLTESTLAVTLPSFDRPYKEGSSGLVASFMTCKIRDPETGKSLPPKKVGEVCLKGPMVMVGYYNNPKATAETFTSDGWLRTGDLGYFDEEGYIFIVDRLKELIKYKGFQVAPAEIEALLLKMPNIRDVGVVGLPDERCGELPTAFVVKHEGVHLTEKQVQDFVKNHLSPPKWLRGGVIFVDQIPKNPTGKILRRALRELLVKQKSKL